MICLQQDARFAASWFLSSITDQNFGVEGGCRNRGLRVHRPTVTTVTPRTYSTIYVIQPPSSLSAPIPPPAAHDRQDAASHTCRPRLYPGVLAQLERIPSGSYLSATPPALPGTVFLY